MKRILVIEDEVHLRWDLLDILGFEGFDALGAENGREGIVSAQDSQPDLIICDITMPGVDGFQVLSALRQDARTSGIPVVLLSAHSDYATVQRGLQLGAAACLPKPYDLSELLMTVRTQVGD